MSKNLTFSGHDIRVLIDQIYQREYAKDQFEFLLVQALRTRDASNLRDWIDDEIEFQNQISRGEAS